eukprot:scaffold3440_cov316-Prasinococcus_capsulatus_cf.AAC.11
MIDTSAGTIGRRPSLRVPACPLRPARGRAGRRRAPPPAGGAASPPRGRASPRGACPHAARTMQEATERRLTRTRTGRKQQP